jgi:hypothetical protein
VGAAPCDATAAGASWLTGSEADAVAGQRQGVRRITRVRDVQGARASAAPNRLAWRNRAERSRRGGDESRRSGSTVVGAIRRRENVNGGWLAWELGPLIRSRHGGEDRHSATGMA